MARSGHCSACGATIRPRAKDMSVGAASRIHYWKHHPEIMLGKRANKAWGKKGATSKKKAKR
jgi:hypothetical protein